MKPLHSLACAGALLAGLAPALVAQRAPDLTVKQSARAAKSSQPTPDLASARCGEMVRLQHAALETASRAQQLARASHLQRAALQAQAMASHNDLQTLLRELTAAEPGANAEQKAVIASLLIHDREADQHAAELVATVQKSTSTGSDVATHAAAEIQHLQQAETALKTDPNTGQATGQRGTVLCNARATGSRRLGRRTGGPTLPSGQATGKRQ